MQGCVDVVHLGVLVLLNTDHVSEAFVYVQNLIELQVLKHFWQSLYQSQQEEIIVLVLRMQLDKLVFGKLRDFEEGFSRHVLNTRMLFVHELVQFVNHRLEERPVSPEEVWELTGNVHNVCGHLRLVTLALCLLAQIQ